MKKCRGKEIEAENRILSVLDGLQQQLHTATDRQMRMEQQIQDQFWMLKELVTQGRLKRRARRRKN